MSMIPHNLTPVYRVNIRKATTTRRQLPVNVDRLWSKLDYGRSLNADCTSAVPMPLTGRCIVGIANERSVA
jgi:hypothetical protein